MAAPAGPVQAVVHAPGGATVVSAGDGRILVWDAASRTLVGGFADLGDPVTGLAIGGDTLIAVAGAAPRGFAAWTVDPAAWRAAGCAVANRSMTDEEWARYGGEREQVAHCG